jgi:type IV pilus assembly protein PilA
MKNQEPGFTLAEMVAVIALISILAVMAVPSLTDRVIKQQIEAALPLADIAKEPVAAAWKTLQTFPADNKSAGLPAPEKIVNNYVSALKVQDGAIHLTFGNRVNKAIDGKVLTLRPAVVADAPVVPVAWVCGNAEAPNQMTLKGENRTDIPNTYLPLACRAIKK